MEIARQLRAHVFGIGLGVLFFFAPLFPSASSADDQKADRLREETLVSPKNPWGEFAIDMNEPKPGRQPWWAQVLLWVPNRVMDFIDIFRADVGVGPSFGGVLRVTKHGQVGYRSMSPLSVRVGTFGRHVPFLVENSNEFGIGPGYISSDDRKVCAGEIGLGGDLFLFGAYGGVCIEEVFDFAAGLFFLDVLGDDLK